MQVCLGSSSPRLIWETLLMSASKRWITGWGHSPMPTSLFVPQVHPGIKEIFQGEELLHVEEVGVAERLGQELVILG